MSELRGECVKMAVNLQKGQKVNLQKSDGSTLKRVMIGLGWDEVERKLTRGSTPNLFFAPLYKLDCDATAFACKNGKLTGVDDIVYYGNLKHNSGCITHMGDNLTGEGEGDDEEIFVDLASLPKDYDRIVFVVNIYESHIRKQQFGMIKNAFIRIVDAENNTELCRYNLTEDYKEMTAVVCGEIYLRDGQWRFNAIGQGTTDPDIKTLAQRFR